MKFLSTIKLVTIATTYYNILEDYDPALYTNYSGCGNTFKGNHPIAARLILDSLRYWLSELHIDGFWSPASSRQRGRKL